MATEYILVIKGGIKCPNCSMKTLHKTDEILTKFLDYDIYDCNFCKARYRTKNLSPSPNSRTIQSASKCYIRNCPKCNTPMALLVGDSTRTHICRCGYSEAD